MMPGECDGMVMSNETLGSHALTTSGAGSTPSVSAARWNEGMDNHQRIWNAIDTIAQNVGLSASGLAKAAGMDATAFNPSKRVDAQGRPHWPSVETIQKILDATKTRWSEFARLVEAGPEASQIED
jgi:hypothetical protein